MATKNQRGDGNSVRQKDSRSTDTRHSKDRTVNKGQMSAATATRAKGFSSETAERERRLQLSRTIKGKYANLGMSSDEFAARKAEEVSLEEKRFRR